ncbi:MAG: alpha/beta hydrolase, partial [Clostridia bacterium]|nr:alpha/beta hydrolase [Clostridia bacterium]
MKIFEDIQYSEFEETKLDVYIPEKEQFPVFVYFHGGGLVNGDKKEGFIEYLVKKGVCVVSAQYRMYPGAKYPDFIADAASAVAWTKNNISSYGTSEGIFVGGSSAGAYLSMMLCFDKKYLAKRGMSNADIAGYYHDAGQPTTHFNVMGERGEDTRRVVIDEAAPIYHISDKEVYPPMEIVVSDNDMANRYEQTMLLVSTLKHFGHDMDKIVLNIQKNSTHCSYVSRIDNGK